MTTVGDRVLNISLPKIGEKSLFTKDLEDALRNHIVDFVVHSLKDLPTTLPSGMTIGAILQREDARDALVLKKLHDGKCLSSLPRGSTIGKNQYLFQYSMIKSIKTILFIGTSSLRRAAQINRNYPHLRVQDIRGNLNTRLAKLDAEDSVFDGIILAQAGLIRMGWQKRTNQILEPDEIFYAVGQGALAVECRSNDSNILKMLQNLVCHRTQCRTLAERSFLKTLGGGCSAPVAVHSVLSSYSTDLENIHELKIIGSVWSLDGKTEIKSSKSCNINFEVSDMRDKTIANEDNDEQFAKRQKLSTENELGEIVCSRSLPKVVDHTQSDQNIDLADSVKINSLLQSCPHFSKKSDMDSKHSNIPVTHIKEDQPCMKCPLKFSVGEDVMAQCPYLTYSSALKSSGSEQETIMIPLKNDAKIDYSVSLDNSISNNTPIKSSDSSFKEKNNSDLHENEEELFCGLHRHRCWSLDVFEECERLGKCLAEQLIKNGALPVMESAQNTIRGKN